MTSSNGNIFRVTGPLCGEFTGYRFIRGTLRFSLICASTSGGVYNRDTVDFIFHHAHYDVTAMKNQSHAHGIEKYNVVKIKFCLRREINQIKLRYQYATRYYDIENICKYIYTKKVFDCVKLTNNDFFRSSFPKRGLTCKKQVVNPRDQTPKGQIFAKPGSPLQNIAIQILHKSARWWHVYFSFLKEGPGAESSRKGSHCRITITRKNTNDSSFLGMTDYI